MTALECAPRARTARRTGDDERGQAEYAGTDAEFARRVLLGSGVGAKLEFDQPEQGRFRFRFRSQRDSHVELVTVVSPGLHGMFDAAGRTVIGWTTGGSLEVTVGERTTIAPAGSPVLFPSTGPFHLGAPEGTLRLVVVDADFSRSVQGLVRDRSCEDLRLSLDPDPAALPALRSSIQAVATATSAPARPRGLSVQVRLLQAVLRAYGPRSVEDPSSAAATTVRLADAYLAEHCHEDVTLPTLSRAIGVSVRTVQSAFLHVRGTTPTVFLREMRLDRVRLALQAADPGETTVAEIAATWGFRHMGRFSAVYHRSFGEYPAETLRRRPDDDDR